MKLITTIIILAFTNSIQAEGVESVKAKIIEVCKEENVNQYLFLAIAERESDFGLTLKNGRGDHGNGFGIYQIDIRYHREFIESHNWRDVRVSCRYAIKLWKRDSASLEHINGAIAAYNCGAGNVKKAWREGRGHDYYTTGKDYASDVIQRMRRMRENG